MVDGACRVAGNESTAVFSLPQLVVAVAETSNLRWVRLDVLPRLAARGMRAAS
jgi:hypothetical protein